jgi:hypothetical protein
MGFNVQKRNYKVLEVKMEHLICIVPFDLSIILMTIHLNQIIS